MTVSSSGPLSGVLVADLSRVLAGPYATMLLGDLGADVIKVERPGSGDDTRAWGPPYAPDGTSTYFASVNRNKRSIALDLTDDGDLAIAQRLTGVADVVIENFAAGSLARYRLDAESCLARNPRAIYCSITGFGSGAGAELPGYDLLVQAMGGLMSVTGIDEPTKAGVAVVDVLTGLHATVAILAGLRERDRTGRGQVIEVSLLSSLLSSLVNQSGAYAGAGVVPGLLGNAHPSIAPYEAYAASDRSMVLAVGNDGQFRALMQVLGLTSLADDPRFSTNPARVAHRSELNAALAPVLASRTADDWHHALMTVGVPCGPINGIDDAFALATRLGLPGLVEVEGSRQVASPAQLSDTPVAYRLAPPGLDSGRQDVLRELAAREAAARS